MTSTLFPRTGAAASGGIGFSGSSSSRPQRVTSLPATFLVDFINLANGKSILSDAATHTRSEFTDAYDNAPATGVHLVTVHSRELLEKVFVPLVLQKDPVVGVRVGVQTEKGVQWSPVETHWITYYDSEPSERSGTFQLCFHTSDALWALDRFPKTLARTGRISEIVQSIADSWGIEAIICKTSASIRMIQSFQSDLKFIVERLIPRAVSEDGRVDYRLRVKANTLIFGPIDFADAQMSIWDVDTAAAGGAVTEIVEEDRSNALIPRGAGGVRAVQASAYGSSSEALSDPESILRLGSFAPDASDKERFISVPVTESEDATEAVAKAQNLFAKQRSEMYQARFNLTNVLGVSVGDYVRFFTPDRSFDSTSKAGELSSYFLLRTETEIEGGTCLQKCVAARGQLSYVPPQTDFTATSATSAAPDTATGAVVNAAGGVSPQMPSQGVEVLDPSGQPTSLPLPESDPMDNGLPTPELF